MLSHKMPFSVQFCVFCVSIFGFYFIRCCVLFCYASCVVVSCIVFCRLNFKPIFNLSCPTVTSMIYYPLRVISCTTSHSITTTIILHLLSILLSVTATVIVIVVLTPLYLKYRIHTEKKWSKLEKKIRI
jgi:hypothetical protein